MAARGQEVFFFGETTTTDLAAVNYLYLINCCDKLCSSLHLRSLIHSRRRKNGRRMSERIEITGEAIDIEGLVNLLDEKMKEAIDKKLKEALQRKPPIEPKIFRAPKSVRSIDESAYEPKLVSIGPYHRAKSRNDFKAMEELKWRLLYDYLSRANDSTDRLLRKMKGFEERARSYYSEVIDIESGEFVEMLLLDGCFLVQIIILVTQRAEGRPQELAQRAEERPQELAQLFDNNMWFENLLLRDLLLLENQLPYFIVKDLLNASEIEERGAFCNALEWFNYCLPNQLSSRPSEALFEGLDVHHLLHLFHKWIMIDLMKSKKTECNEPSPGRLCSAVSSLTNKTKDQLFKLIPCCSEDSQQEQEEQKERSIPTVIELREAGVEVNVKERNEAKERGKAKKGENFLNISFHNGALRIPAISVDDNTSFILRNLVAFEQCCRSIEGAVTTYTSFMDDIINTPRDVKLLCEVKIIDRKLGSDEEIACVFNKMCQGVVFDKKVNHLSRVSEDVKKYCDSTWHRWRAKLMHDYFSNPWAIISVVAAAVLLVLTVLQTVILLIEVLTVLQHVCSPSSG